MRFDKRRYEIKESYANQPTLLTDFGANLRRVRDSFDPRLSTLLERRSLRLRL